MALVFRALPHSVLVTGYLPPFLQSRELLQPLWDSGFAGWFLRLFAEAPPTLYGKPLAIILVLVAINQPFTIWMMRSFFMNIPQDAGRGGARRRLHPFRRVSAGHHAGDVAGVITTGLFSFLLAYNDLSRDGALPRRASRRRWCRRSHSS